MIFSGCSGKTQINPNIDEHKISKLEKDFYEKSVIKKRLKERYEAGEIAGYAKAKKEFETVIPYLEAIRASAELKNSGGLCLPPLFTDKDDNGRLSITVGQAHICEEFTIENVMNIVKHGIPGIPKTHQKDISVDNKTGFTASAISIGGERKTKQFIEKPNKDIKVLQIKIVDNYTNRKILRDSNVEFSNVEQDVNDNNYLLVDFKDTKTLKYFCNKYSICKLGN